MTRSPLTCYACGNEYRYLGRGHHPGRCPRCSSHCVSPAGELAVEVVRTAPERSPPGATVLATDDRRRHLLYRVRAAEEEWDLEAIQVDGHIVRPSAGTESVPLPDPVLRALARRDRVPRADVSVDGEATSPRR